MAETVTVRKADMFFCVASDSSEMGLSAMITGGQVIGVVGSEVELDHRKLDSLGCLSFLKREGKPRTVDQRTSPSTTQRGGKS